VLACAEGHSNQAVADRLGVSKPTVTKWRSRFVARRLEGLADEPRPGAARTITDEQVEQVLVATLETTPTDATHWSTRSLARQLGMSQSAISRIWRAFGLKPHLVDTFKLSTDPQFIEKVRDVVGLYLNPPQAALVLCVDEKTSVQALDRTAPILPLLPGTPQRATHSWLNLVERWFAELTSKWLKRGTHRSVAELTSSIQAWIDTWNQNPRPFVWIKTADEILDTIATYCQRTNDSRH
jgi:transposase